MSKADGLPGPSGIYGRTYKNRVPGGKGMLCVHVSKEGYDNIMPFEREPWALVRGEQAARLVAAAPLMYALLRRAAPFSHNHDNGEWNAEAWRLLSYVDGCTDAESIRRCLDEMLLGVT